MQTNNLAQNQKSKTKPRKFQRFWVKEPRHSETNFAKKRYTLTPLCISDDFGLKSPSHSETTFAKKRYALMPLFQTIWGLRSPPPSVRNQFRQKTVYLNTSMYFRRFRVKEPQSFRNHFRQKTVYLNASMYFRRFRVKEPRHSEKKMPKNGISLFYYTSSTLRLVLEL